MYESTLRITMVSTYPLQENARNVREASCTCFEYKTIMFCVHKGAILGDEHNKMRVFSFPVRKPNPVLEHVDDKSWNCVSVPSTDTDNVILWYVFRRKQLSSLFSSSAAVMVDNRTSRKH